MRIGVIGTGEIARLHAQALERIGERVERAFDVNPQALESFCGETGASPAQNAGTLLEDPALDTLYICTRHDSHGSLAQAACRAGKRVFLEKPVAMSAGEARALWEVWKARPVPFAVGYNMRATSAIAGLRRLLRDKGVKPEAFRANMTGPPFMTGWAADPKAGGGVLVCQGSHLFDLIAHVTDSPIEAVCAGAFRIRQPEELEPNAATLMLRLENGAVGTLLLHDRGNHAYHVEPGGKMVNLTLYAPQGTFSADAYGALRYGTGEYREERFDFGEDRCRAWGYEEQARLFAKACQGLETPLCTLAQAVRTAFVVQAAMESTEKGGWVRVCGA